MLNIGPEGRGWEWGAAPRPLADLMGDRPPAPAWFDAALAMPYTRQTVAVEGADIEFFAWGDPEHPPLLLLHGSMAHAHWWTPVAQILARTHRVVALSFGGMGGSERRDTYHVEQMAREALAVAEAAHLFDHEQRPVCAAHSFGGKPASAMMRGHGNRFGGLMLVDSFIMPYEGTSISPRYKARQYATQADALARFRLSPDQPVEHLYIADAIARRGMKQTSDGQWTWCFDPTVFDKVVFHHGWEDALAAECPLGFIRGEHSVVVPAADFDTLRTVMPKDSRFVTIAEAYHHVMIDQPIALATAMSMMMAEWRNGR